MTDDDNQLPGSAADDADPYGLDSPIAGTAAEGRWGEQRDSAGGGGSKAASKGSEWALYGHAQSHATAPLARPATALSRRSLGLGSDAALHPSTPTPPRRPRASAPHAAHVAWAVDASGSPLHDGRPGSSGGGVARGAGLSSAARSRLAAVESDDPSTVAHILATLRKPCPCPSRPGKEVERLEDELRLARQALTAANEQNKRLATERNRLEQQLGGARANLLKAEELLGVRERVLSPNAGLSRLYRNPDTTALVAGLREQVTSLSADRERLRGQVEQLAKSSRATRVADLQAEVAAQAQELTRQGKMLRVMRQRMEEAETVAAQVVNAMANHVSSRRTALAAATGGDGAAARGPSAAGGRSGSGATSAASALRPPETLPSDNPLSREQIQRTLAVLAQAHGALCSQAALLAEVFPPGLSMEQLGAKAALRAATAGAPEVLRYLRHHVLSLVDTLITLPGGRVTIHPDDAPLPASPTRASAAAAAAAVGASRSSSRGRGLSASPSRCSARGTSAARRRREVPEPTDTGDTDPWVIVGGVSALARRLQGLKPSSLNNDPELAAGLQQLASAVGLFLYEQRRLAAGGGGDDDDDGWPQEPPPLQLLGPRAAAAAAAVYGVAEGTDPYEEAEMVRSPSRLSRRSVAAAPAAAPPAAAQSPRSVRGGAMSRSVSISARSAAGGGVAAADGGGARVAALSRSVSGVSRAASAVSCGAAAGGGGGGAASGVSRSLSISLAAPQSASVSRSPSRVVVRSPSAASSRSPYAPSAAAVAAAASPSRGQSAAPSPRGGDSGSGGGAAARGRSAVSLASARGRHNERYGDGGGSSRRSSGNGGGGDGEYTAGATLGGDGDSDHELLYMHCRQEEDEQDGGAPAGSEGVRGGGSEQGEEAGGEEDGGDDEAEEAPVALALKAAQAALAAARSEAGGSDRDEHHGGDEEQGGDGLDGGQERAGAAEEEEGCLSHTGGEASASALSSRAADADSVVDAGEVDEHEVYSGEYGGVYDDDVDIGDRGPVGGLGGGSSSKEL